MMNIAEPQNIRMLIAHQEGSIVSREIVESKAGTISVFAFDAGQGLSEHTAPFDAFVHVLEGTLDIRIGGTTYAVREGECIIMPANHPHALKASVPAKMLLVLIRAERT